MMNAAMRFWVALSRVLECADFPDELDELLEPELELELRLRLIAADRREQQTWVVTRR